MDVNDKTKTQSEQIMNTSNALGELYKIGLSGLIKTATTFFKE